MVDDAQRYGGIDFDHIPIGYGKVMAPVCKTALNCDFFFYIITLFSSFIYLKCSFQSNSSGSHGSAITDGKGLQRNKFVDENVHQFE